MASEETIATLIEVVGKNITDIKELTKIIKDLQKRVSELEKK